VKISGFTLRSLRNRCARCVKSRNKKHLKDGTQSIGDKL